MRHLVSWSNPRGSWEFFHISKDDHGNTLTLKARVPNWASYTENEDFTTPRVCLARSVKEAFVGLFGTMYESHMPQEEVHVYATDSVPDLFVPNSNGCPDDMPGNPYGLHWSWKEYAEWKGLEQSEEERAKILKGCIPEPETGEIWSLSNLRMKKIGRMWNGPDGKILSKWSLRETSDV